MMRAFHYALALCAWALSVAAGAQPNAPISVLYKRASDQSAVRVDSAVQSALLTIEEKLLDAGLKVLQPDAALYAQLDSAPSFVVNFDEDSGLAVLLDAVKSTRPYPGTDLSYAEVRLRARLYGGARLLATASGSGQIAFRPGSDEKGFELAARRAATSLAEQLATRAAALPPQTSTQAVASLSAPPPGGAASAVALPPPKRRFAILVGVGDFSQTAWAGPGNDLPDTVNDVRLMEKTLLERGVAKENIQILTNAQATAAALRSALQTVRAKATKDDQVILFIASHGMPKDEGIRGFGFPVLYDTQPSKQSTVLDFEEIRQVLGAQAAQQVVWIIDTCHSGGAAISLPVVQFSRRGLSTKRSVGEVSPAVAVGGLAGKDVLVMTAAREEQQSMGDGNNGIFTHALSEALRQSKPQTTLLRIFSEVLEKTVPERRRSIEKCGTACKPEQQQQPGVGYSGGGAGVTL